MRLRTEVAAWGTMTLVLLLLVALSTIGTLGVLIAVAVSIGLALVIAFGPERIGTLLMIAALAAAPLNNFRPGGFVTFSDLFFVLGIGLLLPRLVRHRPVIPPMYYFGALFFLIAATVASLLAPLPVPSLLAILRFVVAAMVLPLAIAVWRPKRRIIDYLAGAYVFGQMVSTAYAYVHPVEAQGRSFGWTTHPNFYGLGGQTAFALLIYLFYRVPRDRRWLLVFPTAVVLDSVLMSGSRASLLCIAMLIVVWPIVERTAISWYVLVSIGVIGLAVANPILSNADPSSALGRIQGGASTTGSNEARTEALVKAFHEFLDKPFTGNGFLSILDVHNAYLEVLMGGGILAGIGFVMMVAALAAGLFRTPVPNRLAYVGLSYAAFAMLGPTLWDRIVWAGLALIFIKPEEPDDEVEAAPPDNVTELTQLTHQGMRP